MQLRSDLWTDPTTTVPGLLDAVPGHQVDELVELIDRAHTDGFLDQLASATRLSGARTGIATPVLMEHWAEQRIRRTRLLTPDRPDRTSCGLRCARGARCGATVNPLKP